jgi:IstB-like ATP binding protein
MTLTKTIARYGRVDLLCIDELGYMALDKRGAELLFQVLTEREEKASVAIASNEAFSGWTKTFTDPRLCAQRSWTASPSAATSSRPAQTHTDSLTHSALATTPTPSDVSIHEHAKLPNAHTDVTIHAQTTSQNPIRATTAIPAISASPLPHVDRRAASDRGEYGGIEYGGLPVEERQVHDAPPLQSL